MKWLKINTVLLVAVLSFWIPSSQADTQFRVIVDASGSMLISDPDKLTSEALRLISNLAPEEKATLGIWLFGEEPRVLLPEAIVNKANKAKLASYVDSYVTQDVKTDLEAIVKLLLDTPDAGNLKPGFNRHWILVTDGMVDISLDEAVNKASRDRILNELTSKLEDRGIHLHTISMTGYTDKDLLESLSLRTNATHTEVAIPEDLLDTFDRIFTQASPSDQLPFDGNRFSVDDAINELTLVVFHETGMQPRIIKPDGSSLSLVNNKALSVSKSDHYTLITIREPEAGEWQVNNVDLDRSNIRIITNLSAQATVISPVMFQNEPISSTIELLQDGEVITDNQLLGLVDVTQTLYRLNGEDKERIISYEMKGNKGRFTQNLQGLSEAGNYELVSVINGQTFSRQLSQFFILHPAINFEGRNRGGSLISFSAKPVNLKLNILQSHVELEFTYNNGRVEKEEMPLVGRGYWEKVIPVSANDDVEVQALLKGVTQAGKSFSYKSPVWHYYLNAGDIPVVGIGPKKSDENSLLAESSQEQSVKPMVVSPVISIVNEEDNNAELLPEAEENKEDPSFAQSVEDEVVSFTKSEWILYAVLNLGAVVVIVGGIVLYRRIKSKKSNKVDNQDDV